ncbi:MAG: hypothetical protein IJU65_11755 [Desulfovibrio sp.]|nr:hypothetical protein [Desulfovibrio sp.]
MSQDNSRTSQEAESQTTESGVPSSDFQSADDNTEQTLENTHTGTEPDKDGAPVAPSAQTPETTDAAGHTFGGWGRAGGLVLLCLLLAQGWSSFLGWNLFCPAEVQQVLRYKLSLAQGLLLAPAANGDYAQWPGFYWLLRGLDWCLAQMAPQLAAQLLFPLAGFMGALLALLAVLLLGRAADLGREGTLAGGFVLFCAPLFVPVSSFTGPQGLALALTLFSLACLCRGWRQEHAFLLLPLGFVCAALAGLTGGPFHLLLPLLASLVFIFWRCTLRRGRGLDGLLGFVCMLLLVGGWLGALILWKPAASYLQSLGQTLVLWPLPALWWKPLALAALGLLPWLAMVCCVSWWRVVRRAPWDLAASRKDRAGVAFLWISLVLACGLSLFAMSHLSAALCIVGIAAPLLGKALLRLSPLGNRMFHGIAALSLLCAGGMLCALYVAPGRELLASLLPLSLTDAQQTVLSDLTGLPLLAGLCVLAALVALRMAWVRPRIGTALFIYACLVVLLTQPAALLLAPQLAHVPNARLLHLEEIQVPVPSQPSDVVAPAPAASDTVMQDAGTGSDGQGAAAQEATSAPVQSTSDVSVPQASAPAAPATSDASDSELPSGSTGERNSAVKQQ